MPEIDLQTVRRQVTAVKGDVVTVEGRPEIDVERVSQHLYGNLNMVLVGGKVERRRSAPSLQEIDQRLRDFSLLEDELSATPAAASYFSIHFGDIRNAIENAASCNPEAMYESLLRAGRNRRQMEDAWAMNPPERDFSLELANLDRTATELLEAALGACGCDFEPV